MLKKVLLGFAILVLVAIGFAYFTLGRLYLATSPVTAPKDYAQQDDSRVQVPAQRGLESQSFDPLKNVYWGDVHVHTVESMDAVLFGTTATVEDAYRFARRASRSAARAGNSCSSLGPLDFVAITDHAEGFGVRTRCEEARSEPRSSESLNCWIMETPNVATFGLCSRGTRQTTCAVLASDLTPPARRVSATAPERERNC